MVNRLKNLSILIILALLSSSILISPRLLIAAKENSYYHIINEEIKFSAFDYLIQQLVQKASNPLEFRTAFLKIMHYLGQELFSEFITYFKSQLAEIEEKYPEKFMCIEMVLLEINWTIRQYKNQ